MQNKGDRRNWLQTVGTVVSIASGIATVVTFVVTGTLNRAVATSIPVVNGFASNLSVLGPWLSAAVLLPMILFGRLLIERSGLSYTTDFELSEVAASAMLFLPLAGLWVWLFRSSVPQWAIAAFLAAYLATLALGVQVSTYVPNVTNLDKLRRARLAGIVLGLVTIAALIMAISSGAGSNLLSVLPGLGPWVTAAIVLSATLLGRLLAEKVHLAFTTDLRLSEVAATATLFLPLAGLWVWLFLSRVPTWATAAFAGAYLVTVVSAILLARNIEPL